MDADIDVDMRAEFCIRFNSIYSFIRVSNVYFVILLKKKNKQKVQYSIPFRDFEIYHLTEIR